MTSLAERVWQPDMVGLPDWRVAELLNAPDASLPKIRQPVATKDAQQILLSTGQWAAILLSAENPETPMLLRSACINLRDTIRQSSMINIDDDQIRAATDAVLIGMVGAGLITENVRIMLLALSERQQSWAEANGIEVTARSVGLARGGV